MKKVYLVTLCTCLVVIALVSASVYFLRDEEKEITVGFVYVEMRVPHIPAILLMRRRQSRQNTGIR